MRELKIAWRNLARGRRRTFTTVFAIASSAIGMMLFGGFVQSILLGFETNIMQFVGQLTVYEKGYSEYGMGKPGTYGISNWRALDARLRKDPFIAPRLRETQPWVDLGGIAGNDEKDASKTFFAGGAIPSLRLKFRDWNDYGLAGSNVVHTQDDGLRDWETNTGVVGLGLAELLKLCGPGIRPCKETKGRWEPKKTANKTVVVDGRPELQLMAGSTGAPNVVRMTVSRLTNMGGKDFNDNYILMHLDLAQRLVYGRGADKVTGLKIQLHKTKDTWAVKHYLETTFKKHHLKLEVVDYEQLWPIFVQVRLMFTTMFTVISAIMAIVALFSINNTMTMCVLERIGEIGTLRSMGMRQKGLVRLFLAEGALVGLLGATLGVGLGALITTVFNQLGVTWQPPSQTERVPLTLLVFNARWFVPACWSLLVAAGTLSAVFPAAKAGKLNIVDALRAA